MKYRAILKSLIGAKISTKKTVILFNYETINSSRMPWNVGQL